MSLLLLFSSGTGLVEKIYLPEAIMNVFIAQLHGISNDLYDALGGRLYYESAPEQEIFPYGVFSIISEVPVAYLDTTVITDYIVQFNLYSDKTSSYEINTLSEYLYTLFEESSIVITGKNTVRMNKELDRLDIEDLIWYAISRWRVKVYER